MIPTIWRTPKRGKVIPPQVIPPVKLGDPKVVNIQDCGVDNTGTHLQTVKTNGAIKDVFARPGGGVLFFPPGVYLAGTILMRNNVHLYVDASAVVRNAEDLAQAGLDVSVPAECEP